MPASGASLLPEHPAIMIPTETEAGDFGTGAELGRTPGTVIVYAALRGTLRKSSRARSNTPGIPRDWQLPVFFQRQRALQQRVRDSMRAPGPLEALVSKKLGYL